MKYSVKIKKKQTKQVKQKYFETNLYYQIKQIYILYFSEVGFY